MQKRNKEKNEVKVGGASQIKRKKHIKMKKREENEKC